jgi:hypothetical protein
MRLLIGRAPEVMGYHVEAAIEQLGLKLVPRKGPADSSWQKAYPAEN